MSRFFFALGQIALQQLVHVEESASAVRRVRLAAEKRAAEARAEHGAAGGRSLAGWLLGGHRVSVVLLFKEIIFLLVATVTASVISVPYTYRGSEDVVLRIVRICLPCGANPPFTPAKSHTCFLAPLMSRARWPWRGFGE